MQPVATGASTPPWPPAQLIAEPGRRAVQLLDTDTPPRATTVTAAPRVEAGTVTLPKRPDPEPGAVPLGSGAAVAYAPGAATRRTGRRIALVLARAAVVAGGVLALSAAGLPPFGEDPPSGVSSVPRRQNGRLVREFPDGAVVTYGQGGEERAQPGVFGCLPENGLYARAREPVCVCTRKRPPRARVRRNSHAETAAPARAHKNSGRGGAAIRWTVIDAPP